MSSDDANKKPLSFGFSKKKKEAKVLETNKNVLGLGLGPTGSLGSGDLDGDNSRVNDLITSIDAKRVISAVPKEEPKQLIIPLLKRNTWSIGSKTTKKQKVGGDTTPKSSERLGLDDAAAVKEVLADTAKQNLEWDDRGNEDMGMSIPLLMRNKVPDGFETDEKLDVSIRPNEATDADYDEVPISQFGIAMIRGMGWKEGEGIGGKKEVVNILEPKARPKGQGLGAAPKPPEFSKKPKRPLKPGEKRQEETPVGYAKGVGIMATKGLHKNMYGRIVGVDEDNAQLIIKLAIGGQTVTISQYIANIVDDDEYKKYAKDLSRFSKCKRKEQDKEPINEDYDSKRKKEEDRKEEEVAGSSNRLRDDHHQRSEEDDSKRRKEKYRQGEKEEGPSNRHRDRDDHHQKRKKHKHKYTDEKYSDGGDVGSKHRRNDKDENKTKEQSSSKSHQQWLHPDLRVRFIDKHYKKGKYYMSKVNIEDVVTPEQCTCKTDDGYLMYDISESMLETVIPKSDPGYVMIVLGRHKGKLGIVVDKRKDRQKADVQLLQDRDTIVHLRYEEISQYAGDLHNNEDF